MSSEINKTAQRPSDVDSWRTYSSPSDAVEEAVDREHPHPLGRALRHACREICLSDDDARADSRSSEAICGGEDVL